MHNHLKGFSLLPYTLDNGQQITMTSQMSKADESMLKEYYSKNCVLQHGNLTGMVHFQTSTPWSAVKGFNSQYFSWLKKHKMYLNLTKFKPDTLVPSGFLVGTHPSFLRWTEAEEELHGSLSIDPDELPFQLSTRTISVLLKDGEPGRFSFRAIVVETTVKFTAKLREYLIN
jgi:hypothetical protein